ncbi:ROK family protein [Erwiniaceae bacterium BAC15a-03b]|uniref:ROK family protein n=1 Tax=Winslowiella arboricola TaxID=2978220 RepID=A0A9J6PMR3_9GAMM|nr:ROK family protein [Winslowiella arboricola]MCU5774054.1 ROK family protein [Winslowiella arboricola]MCU5777013.1 ROK family protein [Winslowiella arboricola]
MKESGKGPALLRLNNEKRLLTALRQQRITTRQDIAGLLALSKNTVSLIIDDLIAREWVQELGPLQVSAAGRPKIGIALCAGKLKAAGVMIERQRMHVTVTDYLSEVLEESSWQTDTRDPARVLSELQTVCQQLQQRHPELLGIGLGFPGIVDPAAGYLHISSHLGWRDVDIQAALHNLTGTPLHIMNYVKAAALLAQTPQKVAEGASCFYLRIGEGIGGALLLGRDIFTGSSWTAGEAGHLTVADGPACSCGKYGCLEALISVPAIQQQLAAVEQGLSWDTREQSPESTDKVMTRAGHYLGKALSQIMLLLNPSTLVIDSPWNSNAAFCTAVKETAQAATLAFTFNHTQMIFLSGPLSPAKGLALAVIERNEVSPL